MNDAADNSPDRPQTDAHETIGGILASALNMEDQISSGVYEDYVKRENWPGQLDEDAFLEIRKRLTTLIDDTTKHQKILETLARQYRHDK